MKNKHKNLNTAETMRYYAQVGMLDKAIQLGIDTPADDHAKKELIKIYVRQNKIEDARKIVDRNLDNTYLVTALLEYYLENNNVDDAIAISKKQRLEEYIQSKIINALIKQDRFEEATARAANFKDNPVIAAQLANIYYLSGQDDKLFKIIDENKTNNNIKSIELKWMLDLGLVDDATDLAKQSKDDIMRGQVIFSLIENNRFKEISDIYNQTTELALQHKIYKLIKNYIGETNQIEDLDILSRSISK